MSGNGLGMSFWGVEGRSAETSLPPAALVCPADNTYLCLAVLDGVFCVIFLHGRSSPQNSPTSTPKLTKSLSFELQPDELMEKPMAPMHYARSGLGTAEMNGRLIAAGKGPSTAGVPLLPWAPTPQNSQGKSVSYLLV